MSKKIMNIIAGLDIGNGYVKGKLSVDGGVPTMVDMPSVVTYTKVQALPVTPDDAYVKNFDNMMDVEFSSRIVDEASKGRMYVGERAISAGTSLREFDINNVQPKCEDSLSTILTLSAIASVAFRHYWGENHALPQEEIACNVVAAMALPIEDYMRYKDRYAEDLMRTEHRVIIHNFEQDVVVRIKFDDVRSKPEGAAAQYAITSLGGDFLQAVLDDSRRRGVPIDPEYTGAMLATQVRNTIGVDIGEGTVNFPVFTNGAVNIEASKSINSGYGTVLENVVAETVNDSTLRCSSRKDLASFLLEKNLLPQGKRRQAALRKLTDEQVIVFVRELMRTFNRVFADVGGRTDAIYVYGGGASSVQFALYDELVKAVTGDLGTLPVIYLDSSYSRDLNRTGLYSIAYETAKVVWAKKTA